jgi:hypothetical protein
MAVGSLSVFGGDRCHLVAVYVGKTDIRALF